ncbi:MAG TPA: type I restriction-modification system subunit M [Firmicutes bacterium]|nr:type I restriction-modification system subunit M [Bacillota bacterium]
MAVKKSDLYSTLWASCDELRGGMDASQYKDYVLTILFVKYVSDKYKGDEYADIVIPEGGSFDDILNLRGKTNIGEGIDKVISKLAEANKLEGIIDNAKFNDEEKIGKGKDMVDKLTSLVEVFNKPELNFKNNRASGDDIIGDAYEYLMKHFATESGKSKGQFYTPAEVSRIMAKLIGINKADSADVTLYDPTCGSGSLLIRAADEANADISIYGQEKDNATRGLAKMNMVLHNKAAAEIMQGNTLSDPQFKAIDPITKNTIENEIRTFDFIVANPPFSVKNWRSGVDLDKYGRFKNGNSFPLPPEKNGDYAFLLHVIKSLNSTGKGAIILPHGVLFRGNAEGDIRTWIIKQGFIKAVIGLPANLFFGTGIPACIIILDKENAGQRKSIFMIDASKGFTKDGDKNRLREQDIYKIITTYTNRIEEKGYSKDVQIDDLIYDENTKQYTLNIPRYIESNEKEDVQDIDAHLYGGIPEKDIDDLGLYWNVFPSIKEKLFSRFREGYLKLKVSNDEIRNTIYTDDDYKKYADRIDESYEKWLEFARPIFDKINLNNPRESIELLSNKIVDIFKDIALLDKYDVYQVLMTYWLEVMSDDFYSLFSTGSWIDSNEIEVFYKEQKKKKTEDETKLKEVGWEGKLIPKELIIERYFAKEADDISRLEEHINSIENNISQMEDDYGSEGEVLFDFYEGEKIKSANVDKVVKKKNKDNSYTQEEFDVLVAYSGFNKELKDANKQLKDLKLALDTLARNKIKELTEQEIKEIVINDKWSRSIFDGIDSLYIRISHGLANRILELAERYEDTLFEIEEDVDKYENQVKEHLRKLGFIKKQE